MMGRENMIPMVRGGAHGVWARGCRMWARRARRRRQELGCAALRDWAHISGPRSHKTCPLERRLLLFRAHRQVRSVCVFGLSYNLAKAFTNPTDEGWSGGRGPASLCP